MLFYKLVKKYIIIILWTENNYTNFKLTYLVFVEFISLYSVYMQIFSMIRVIHGLISSSDCSLSDCGGVICSSVMTSCLSVPRSLFLVPNLTVTACQFLSLQFLLLSLIHDATKH